MFQLLFKYPSAVFSKGRFVLLSGWPTWLLILLLIAAATGLALMIRSRLPRAAPQLRKRRLVIIWALESALLGLLLVLLWQPAFMIAELKPHQNIVTVLIDDSRSMGIADNGVTRETQAVRSLESGALGSLQQKFQTHLYRLDHRLTRISGLAELKASASATRIDDSLKQLMEETSGLPLGAVVLLSDGSDNTGGIGRETIAALRERHVPVYTVGFGREQMTKDVEIEDVQVEARSIAGSRMAATISFRQRGYSGSHAVLRVSDGSKAVGEKEITFAQDGELQTQTLLFDAGDAGQKSFQFSVSPQPGETNAANNNLTRLVDVESGARRVLYVEGEPRWEYKFIRRAEDDDRMVELASMVRTTANNIYRQGVENPGELADGFPSSSEDLFKYQGLIIGSVEAAYFTPAQQELIKEFVDRRGGGVLFLGGRLALADGGWGASSVADLLPVVVPNRKDTFQRDPARAELTPAGADSIICRLAEDPGENAARWKKLPYMLDYQDPGKPKPGAVVLAGMATGRGKLPLLVVENYGHGRTAVLATGGTWRWRMQMPLQDQSHDIFWRQLLRWLVTGTPGQLVASITNPILYDNGKVQLTAQVRDKDYLPESNASVEAHVSGPGGGSDVVELAPSATIPGLYQGEWTASQPGLYQARVVARVGNAIEGQEEVSFERMDNVAENFHTEQNRELLQQLSRQTGGHYWRPQHLSAKLASEIPYSEAGITTREEKDLWNMPAVFLLIIALKASEWLLRRKWGIL